MMADSTRPTLDEWLSATTEEIASVVAPRHLGLMLSNDGTRRHYLIHTGKSQIDDFEDYTLHSAASHVRVYECLFRLGVETILSAMLYPPNFVRSPRYLRQAVDSCSRLFLTGAFQGLYERCGVRARLYGDYDLAPLAAPVRTDLITLAERLREATPQGDHLLLYGFTAGSFVEEMIARTLALKTATKKAPNEESLKRACFPEGPEQLDILIDGGWMRVGSIVPPVLDRGKTDLYYLNHLSLDLSEETARRILYDHLFLRWAGPEDDAVYEEADLAALRAYYQSVKPRVSGLGELVGPGVWYFSQG